MDDEQALPLYRIRDWATRYENNRTRELKVLHWVPIPTKLDGDGYTELISHENGAAIYGAWVGCVIVAARCEPRGTLLRTCGVPHCGRSLSRITRMPENVVKEMLRVALTIGWLERCENLAPSCGAGAVISHQSALEGKGIESAAQALRGALDEMEESQMGGMRMAVGELVSLLPRGSVRPDKDEDRQLIIGAAALRVWELIAPHEWDAVIKRTKRRRKDQRVGYMYQAFRGVIADRGNGSSFDEMLQSVRVPPAPWPQKGPA